MPAVGKYVCVQGAFQGIVDNRCSLAIQDVFLSSQTGPTTQSPPSNKLKRFDWYTEEKGKGKQARYEEEGRRMCGRSFSLKKFTLPPELEHRPILLHVEKGRSY